MKTTLNQIRAKSPCTDGWKKLLAHLSKTAADDEPLSIVTILDSNGLNDALWCLQAVKGHAREIRLYAVWCAREVQHLMTDPRSISVLDVAERFANGDASRAELASAGEAAGAATVAAIVAAAGAAAGVAAVAAAGAAAGAAWEAVGDAAWEAAGAAARAAAWFAAQDTTGNATGFAAGNAAGVAAWAAQEKRLREICAECDIAQRLGEVK